MLAGSKASFFFCLTGRNGGGGVREKKKWTIGRWWVEKRRGRSGVNWRQVILREAEALIQVPELLDYAAAVVVRQWDGGKVRHARQMATRGLVLYEFTFYAKR